jgi:tRNA-splicing ligase RtcB (3'-phosphate/5'-hydroxy nucleic acid ligase)
MSIALNSSLPTPPPLHTWLAGPLPEGVERVLARLAATADITHIAVMPDVHLAGDFCVGTVVATTARLFPTAVGGDIGCGMLALQFDVSAERLADPDRAAQLLGALCELAPARRHHRGLAPEMPGELLDLPLSHPHLAALLKGDAALQLGTLGAGNHFLEFQRDEAGALWLMLHTGSRNFGQAVYHQHLPAAQRTAGGLAALEADSAAGRAYLMDLHAARQYAAANRYALALRAARAAELVLGARPLLDTLVDCDHNHLQIETHFGRLCFVHRKGATAARAEQPGIVPGSMGDGSFHTLGRGCPESLDSCSHGAGRALSRTQARETVTIAALRQRLRGVWYDRRLERELREEAPQAYKPIAQVMQAQRQLTRVVRRLRAVLVYKGT